jgi:hypothetical protein
MLRKFSCCTTHSAISPVAQYAAPSQEPSASAVHSRPMVVRFLTGRKYEPFVGGCLRFLGHVGGLLVLVEGVCLLCIAVYSEVCSSPRTAGQSGARLNRFQG